MRRAGALVAQVLEQVRQAVKPRVSTAELNALAERPHRSGLVRRRCSRAFGPTQAKFPYPAALCTSVNEEVVHGVPGIRVLAEGDIISVDCGVRLDGYCGDAAITVAVGRISADAERLMRVTQESLAIAVKEIQPGRKWADVARQMQQHVERAGFSVVREFVGHGIGRSLHEDPKVPNFVGPGHAKLRPGARVGPGGRTDGERGPAGRGLRRSDRLDGGDPGSQLGSAF